MSTTGAIWGQLRGDLSIGKEDKNTHCLQN